MKNHKATGPLRNLRRLLNAKRRIQAWYMATAGSWQDLQGRPGAMTGYSVLSEQTLQGYDVCCPGCGEHVAAIDPEEHPITGDPPMRDGPCDLSCSKTLQWHCCGWSGRLVQGVWIDT